MTRGDCPRCWGEHAPGKPCETILERIERIKRELVASPLPLPPADAEPPPRPHNETDREETTP
jgi:hypothetical protein